MTGPCVRAPGLTADWLNSWMAALGVCVLAPELKLSWSSDPIPVARFSVASLADLATVVADRVPDRTSLDAMPFSRHLDGSGQDLVLDPPIAVFAERAGLSRSVRDESLPALHTDLGRDRNSDAGGSARDRRRDPNASGDSPTGSAREREVLRGPLYPGAPAGRTMHQRVMDLRDAVGTGAEARRRVGASLEGRGERAEMMGLCFDYRRLTSWSEASSKPLVDPVIELLAFASLALFPLRGDGRHAHQRGWIERDRRPVFVWPSWRPPLDRWGIDALLDQVAQSRPRVATRLGCDVLFESVRFRKRNKTETDEGFASKRIG